MKLKDFYRRVVETGIANDLRGAAVIASLLEEERARFDKLPEDDRVDFDTDRLFNALPLFHSFGLTVGTLLPLLCAGDLFSMYHYWGRWERRNLKFLLPGVVAGVVLGVQLIERFRPNQLNFAIGLSLPHLIDNWGHTGGLAGGILLALGLIGPSLFAQQPYKLPPKEIVDILQGLVILAIAATSREVMAK